ncbi:FecCD family ABC transporter permease [Caldalkalibacillus salinus]|uniref:FecCD family ABC transporter permease n=1 Tax=Caldalkalibacillus salinus TaxID=2803787 RepID=UPI00192213E5|nr:iron ABC transporter permease [Caldalkalibacillus salinus]
MKKYIPLRLMKGTLSFLISKRLILILPILSLVTLLVMVISTGMGDMKIGPVDVVKAVIGQGSDIHTFVVQIHRLPRIVVAFLVGAALAIAGAILQGMIRNPLASPDVIGITGGASVAAVTFLTLYSDSGNTLTISIHWLPVAAFVGALIAAALVYTLSWHSGVTPIRLVLIGIGLAFATDALTTLMIIEGPLYLATQATLWQTGSVYASTWQDVQVLLPWLLICLFIALIAARRLNVLEMGEDIASSVGSHVQRNRLLLLLLSTALAGAAVSVAGGIGFVGLMAPHIARRLIGSSFGALIPVSAMIGGLIVIMADLVARTAFLPLDLPAGIFTAAIGAPYFIFLLFRHKNL